MRFQFITTKHISGLGDDVKSVVDTHTDEILGHIGSIKGKEVIHFIKPIPIRRIIKIAEQLQQELVLN